MNPQTQFPVTRPNGPPTLDTIAEETPIAFEYNGISHTVMLATPADLEDFALGFSLTEGIVDKRSDVFDIEITEAEAGITVHLKIAGGAFARLKEHRRSQAGRTGCGLCGAESLAQVMRDLPPVADAAPFPVAALYEGMRRLPELQMLQHTTGAVHAACRIAADGSISHVREDVGRHNALDKTLGALARDDAKPGGALLITSRASFEMVQKSAALGYGILAAVSAPTAAAVRLAEKLDVTLVGFLRGANCAVYSHPHRLQGITK
ncbi:MAG: formate dehydrogenase accessory sulfurtransferase FdhD [Nitrosomonadales bacterium]|nr:formate dehydrogenase accessory sulfurtransferase FdhD [Nitrosomonadales bacterium]